MKAEMPIVIALALVLSLVIATIYYSTSTLNYISTPSSELQEAWRSIEDSIDTLLLSTLASSSNQSGNLFATAFWGRYQEYMTIPPPKYPFIVRKASPLGWKYDPEEYDICPRTMTWTIVYNYDDYKCFGLCQYNYSSTGFSQSYTSYVNALNSSAQTVSNYLGNTLYDSISNWASIMRSQGYTIYPAGVEAYYGISIWSDPSTGASYTIVKLRLNATVDVYNPYLGYKRITRWVEIGYNATFSQGYWKYDGIYLQVNITAYTVFNNVRSSYIIDPRTATLTVYSGSLFLLNFTVTNKGNITMKPVAYYYYGNGTTTLVFKIPIQDRYQWPWLQEVVAWSNLVLSSATCDDSYPPPYSLSNPDPGNKDLDALRRSVTVAFLWATLLNVEIYGFNLTGGLKIVFKYYANTNPPIGDWVDSIPFDLFGDERASFPPGTVV
ncbi:hypothetical protein ACSU1N_00740 [Thermogladius sp. 4427co]|uniref:hypothetical protein n=1 Tax=Thermogladius sp. 4427co TaxID=3450718 RepID=UPI003F7A319C